MEKPDRFYLVYEDRTRQEDLGDNKEKAREFAQEIVNRYQKKGQIYERYNLQEQVQNGFVIGYKWSEKFVTTVHPEDIDVIEKKWKQDK